MGTKLQFAIHPLVASSNNSFLLNQLSNCGYPPKIGSNKHSENCSLSYFNHSVDEEMFDLHNIESIKKTMLIQDDIFKLQVRELHQLYERQMKLMYELKNDSDTNIKKGGSNLSGFAAIWNQPIRDIKSNLPVYTLRAKEEEEKEEEDPLPPPPPPPPPPLELSASCSGDSTRMQKGLNLEQQQQQQEQEQEQEQQPRSTSENEQKKGVSSSRLSRTDDEEIDVELTLSIGCSRNNNTKNRKTLKNQVNQYCSRELVLSGSSDSSYCGRNLPSSLIKRDRIQEKGDSGQAVSSSSSSAKLNQNINNSSSNWFFQDLSLNRT